MDSVSAMGKGEVNTWVTREIAAAKQKGLGLVIGMNVLAGSSAAMAESRATIPDTTR